MSVDAVLILIVLLGALAILPRYPLATVGVIVAGGLLFSWSSVTVVESETTVGAIAVPTIAVSSPTPTAVLLVTPTPAP